MELSEALYVISVASRLVEMHPATLRKYERVGLVEPSRSSGNIRLYSGEDIARLRQIKYLVEERGMNLAGVELALTLTIQLQRIAELLEGGLSTESDRHRARECLQQALSLLGVQRT